MSRTRLVAGNWKLNGSIAMCRDLVGAIRAAADDFDADVAVFPPFPYLAQVQELAAGSRLAWGGQDLSVHASGAYTGETAGAMLLEFGCTMVLCGHSERRAYHAEDDALVGAKANAALQAGLTPVVCLGETLAQREEGSTQRVVAAQLDAVVEAIGVAGMGRTIVAYEPVWAIGTGKTATPEQAQEVHAYIRSKIAELDATIAGQLRILYGGSVKGSNAADLFAQPDIDGGLIGGASLRAEDFLSICRA